MESLTDSGKLKELLKQAIIEAMEDLAMIRAIQEGEESAPASREQVFNILEGLSKLSSILLCFIGLKIFKNQKHLSRKRG